MHHSSPRRDPLSSDRFFGVVSGGPQEISNTVSSVSLSEDNFSREGISFVFGHNIYTFCKNRVVIASQDELATP